MRLTALALRYHRFVTLLTLFFAVGGMLAVWRLPREVWPEVDLATVIIEAEYPSATAEQVAELILHPLERELKGVSDLRHVASVAVEGRARITIAIEPDAPDSSRVVDEIQRAVDRTDDLPADLPDRPLVREVNTRHDPVLAIALGGTLPQEELQVLAKRLETQLSGLPGLAKVDRVGWRDRIIAVEVDPGRLQQYQITVEGLAAALRAHNVNVPGGPMLRCRTTRYLVPNDTRYQVPGGTFCAPAVGEEEVLLRTAGEFATPDDVAAVVVRANDVGRGVRVGDVARVAWGLATAQTLFRTAGTPGVLLNVIKRPAADAVALARAVRAATEQFRATAPPALQITFPNDFSYYVGRRLQVLLVNGCIGLALVILVLLLFLSRQSAIGAGLGIPIALGAAATILYWCGASINLVTLFGIIMCLGMLVDEDIVIAESIHRHTAVGGDLRERIAGATGDLSRSICTTACTTIAAFVPMLFVEGIIGKFIRWIPIVVIVTLIASLIEALCLLPTHLYHLLHNARAIPPPRRLPWFEWCRAQYTWILAWALAHRRRVLAGFVGGMVIVGVGGWYGLRFLLFPPHGVEFFFIRAEAPSGTPLTRMAALIGPIEAAVARLPRDELDTFVTDIGVIQEEPNDPLMRYGSHLAQVAVYLHPEGARDRTAADIIAALRADLGTPVGLTHMAFARVSTGPYVGRPIAIQLRGDDPATLSAAAAEVRAYLATVPGVRDLHDDGEEQRREMHLAVDTVTAMRAGFSLREIGRVVRAAYAGETATTIRRTDEEIDVVVRYPADLRATDAGLRRTMIGNSQGQLTPLPLVAQPKEAAMTAFIRHLDFKRAVTVTADVDEATTTPLAVQQAVQQRFADWAARYPGLVMSAGGEVEESNTSLASMFRAMGIALLLIVGVLLAGVPNTAGVVAVLTTIPCGMAGIVIGFLLLGEPLSFMACFGAIGLAGVIVDSALIVVTLAERLQQEGRSLEEAIAEACHTRFRPIALVTLTTTLALFPSASGIGGNDPLIQPAALAMDCGLAIGTLIALIAVPVVYVTLAHLRHR